MKLLTCGGLPQVSRLHGRRSGSAAPIHNPHAKSCLAGTTHRLEALTAQKARKRDVN
jgi:hypothetical protein